MTACSPGALAAVVDACVGPTATDATCHAAGNVAANALCFQCVFSGSTDANWGPLLSINEPSNAPFYPLSNPAGCVAAKDPAHGRTCQTALDAVTQCEIASCVRTCPATDAGLPALVGAFDSSGNLATPGCIEDALDGPACASFVSGAKEACANEVNDAGTGALDTCNALAASQNIEDLRRYFGLVCGGLAPATTGDAGTHAADAG